MNSAPFRRRAIKITYSELLVPVLLAALIAVPLVLFVIGPLCVAAINHLADIAP